MLEVYPQRGIYGDFSGEHLTRCLQYVIFTPAGVKYVVRYGVRYGVQYGGGTILPRPVVFHTAVDSEKTRVAVMRYLVSLGADTRECAQLAGSVQESTLGVARYLVSLGAAQACRGEVARLLVAFGAPAPSLPGAARAAYLWWGPRCYARGRRAGRRMARRNYLEYRRLCA